MKGDMFMKHIEYSFTDSDIQTCIFALSLLDSAHSRYNVPAPQILINEHCALSATEKLASLNSSRLTPNELRVLCVCISYCALVCQNPSLAEPVVYKECMKYIFTLNKLRDLLCSQIM